MTSLKQSTFTAAARAIIPMLRAEVDRCERWLEAIREGDREASERHFAATSLSFSITLLLEEAHIARFGLDGKPAGSWDAVEAVLSRIGDDSIEGEAEVTRRVLAELAA